MTKLPPVKTPVAATPIRVVENPFGDFDPEQLAGKPDTDRFYLKGYSDKRHERDLAMKVGEKPEMLNHRFQYVPIQRADGTPNKTKYVEWIAKGYRPVQWDEAKALGLDLDLSTAEKGADGTVRVATQILMVTDRANAARHYQEQRDSTERLFEDNVETPLKRAADTYNKKHGHSTKTGTTFEIE